MFRESWYKMLFFVILCCFVCVCVILFRKLRSWSSMNSVIAIIQPRTTIEDLPEEMLLRVLSFVDQDQLLSTISLVNRRWNKIHSDASLYRTLTFDAKNPTTAEAIKMIHMARWLTSLTVINRTDTDELLLHVGQNHPLLVKLEVRACTGSLGSRQVAITSLIHVVRNCAQLKHVSLQGIYFDCGTFDKEMEPMLSNLRIIDLGMKTYTSFDFLTNIAQYCDNIEEIRMSHHSLCYREDIQAEEIFAFCKRSKESLSVFDLGCNVSWSDSLLASVAKCQNVKELYLLRAENITDTGLMEITRLPKLKVLKLMHVKHVTKDCWIQFFNSPYISGLNHLSLLYCTNVEDTVVRTMATRLRQLEVLRFFGCRNVTKECWIRFFESPYVTKLHHLSLLCCTNVDDTVAWIIANNLCQLQVLSICWCSKVTENGWIKFFESPYMSRLQRLSLFKCSNVDDTVVCTIATNLRQLQVLCIHCCCKVTKKGELNLERLVSESCKLNATSLFAHSYEL